MRVQLSVRDQDRLALGLGLVSFGMVLAVTNNFVAAFFIGFGVYLAIKSLSLSDRGGGEK